MSRTITILLADDDFEDRMIVSHAFKEIGKDSMVQYVENGEEALQYLDAINDTKLLPSLIVLDLNMPRLNGTETLRAIKMNRRFADIPVMIFSTSVNELEKDECLRLGAVSYLTKPAKYLESLEVAEYFYNFTVNSQAGNQN